jgi:hypothetical protein
LVALVSALEEQRAKMHKTAVEEAGEDEEDPEHLRVVTLTRRELDTVRVALIELGVRARHHRVSESDPDKLAYWAETDDDAQKLLRRLWLDLDNGIGKVYAQLQVSVAAEEGDWFGRHAFDHNVGLTYQLTEALRGTLVAAEVAANGRSVLFTFDVPDVVLHDTGWVRGR